MDYLEATFECILFSVIVRVEIVIGRPAVGENDNAGDDDQQERKDLDHRGNVFKPGEPCVGQAKDDREHYQEDGDFETDQYHRPKGLRESSILQMASCTPPTSQ